MQTLQEVQKHSIKVQDGKIAKNAKIAAIAKIAETAEGTAAVNFTDVEVLRLLSWFKLWVFSKKLMRVPEKD